MNNGFSSSIFSDNEIKQLKEKQVVERNVLRMQVKKILSDAILGGQLKPGDRIIETRIARELGVSQAPVREAIRELEQTGLVETKPYQGAFVKKLSREELQEAYSVRALLEGEAAKEAARKIEEEDLKELDELMEEMMTAINKGDVNAFIATDIAFHEKILMVAGNHLVYKIWKEISMANLTLVTTKLWKRNLPELGERHRNLLESLRAGDSVRSEELMRSHIEDLSQEILQDF